VNASPHRRPVLACALALATAALIPATALADGWTETGDAGDSVSTAQSPSVSGDLTSISGYLNTDGTDADMYKICLNGGDYSVVNPRGVNGDETKLFDGTLTLVDGSSTVVDFNDEDPGDTPEQSSGPDHLPAKAGPPPAGIYYLAITSWPRYPKQANDEAADDPGEVLDHFGDGNPFGGSYSMSLSGVRSPDYERVDGPLTPFQTDGSARFKAGTTLEIRVKPYGCDGKLVTGLTPRVNIVRTGNLTGPTTPTVAFSTRSADKGTAMRYSAQFGQYQLYPSTKKSEFNGGKDLTPGRYRVDVTDPSFPGGAHKVARNFSIVP
jgi:hypothetical protein